MESGPGASSPVSTAENNSSAPSPDPMPHPRPTVPPPRGLKKIVRCLCSFQNVGA